MPRELPKIKMDEKTYYVDSRLMQLRNVDDPHDWMEIDPADLILLSIIKGVDGEPPNSGMEDYLGIEDR